jgi:N-methylhydantoinase A
VQAVTWRLWALSRTEVRDFRLDAAAGAALLGPRPVYLPGAGGYAEVPVYARYRLPAGTRLDGPLVLQEDESTVVVARPARVEVADNLTVSVFLNEAI